MCFGSCLTCKFNYFAFGQTIIKRKKKWEKDKEKEKERELNVRNAHLLFHNSNRFDNEKGDWDISCFALENLHLSRPPSTALSLCSYYLFVFGLIQKCKANKLHFCSKFATGHWLIARVSIQFNSFRFVSFRLDLSKESKQTNKQMKKEKKKQYKSKQLRRRLN